MKRGAEKIVSIEGWGAAGMMRNSFHCDKGLPVAAFKASKPPMPNQTPNPSSCEAINTACTGVKRNDRSPNW
jgi:hypothetical protein